TQAFSQTHSQVRLRPMQTEGAAESAKALAEGKADLAIIRGDLDVPKNAQAVATLRKNVAVLWVPPPAKGKGKKAGPKITKIAQNHPVYEASEIPAGAFGGSPNKPEEEVKTISFSHHIAARKGLPESTVATFTRQLFAIRQTLKTEFPLAAKIETPDTDKDAV